MKCHICGADVREGSKFCMVCGAKLAEAPAAQPAVTTKPQADAPWASAPAAKTTADAPWASAPAAKPQADAPWASAPAAKPQADAPWASAPAAKPVAAAQPEPAAQAETPVQPQPMVEEKPVAQPAANDAAKSAAFWGEALPASAPAQPQRTAPAKAAEPQREYQEAPAEEIPQPQFFEDNDAPVVSVGHWVYTLLLLILLPIAVASGFIFLCGVLRVPEAANYASLVAAVISLILMFIWAFSKRTNPSKRNYFRAALIVTAILVVVIIILIGVLRDQIMYTLYLNGIDMYWD